MERGNNSRFFQLNGAMLFEYEFSGSGESDITEYNVGKSRPFIFNLLDGSKQYVDTVVTEEMRSNNYVKTMSIPHDENGDIWYKIKPKNGVYPTYSDYVRRNIQFGITKRYGNSGKMFIDTREYSTDGYDEIIDRILLVLGNMGYEEIPLASDITPSLFEIFKDQKLKKLLVGFAIANKNDLRDRPVAENGYPYMFRYYSGEGVEYLDDFEIDIDYYTAATNLCYDYNYYDKYYNTPEGRKYGPDYCTRLSDRIKWTFLDELIAFCNKERISDMDSKLITCDYSDKDRVSDVVNGYISGSDFLITSTTEAMQYDTIRIYFVGGYYINDEYGIQIRVSVEDENSNKVVLTNLLLTKERDIEYTYMNTPLYLSNRVYDKYIQVRVPSVRHLSSPANKKVKGSLSEYLNVKTSSSIKVEYSGLNDDMNEEYSKINTEIYEVADAVTGNVDDKESYLYGLTDLATCALPQEASSDRIGAMIDEEDNCIVFGGTWKLQNGAIAKLDYDIIKDFNTKYVLYNLNSTRNVDLYHADDKSVIEWLGYHEVVAEFYTDSGSDIDMVENPVVKPAYIQRYNFTEVFSAYEPAIESYLRYKPIINQNPDNPFKDIVFKYTFRLVNTLDDVQFLRKASISISGNKVNEILYDTHKIEIPVNVYNVYNKLEETNQVITTAVESPVSVKYTKVYYNSSNIVLDSDGNYNESGTYTLPLSNAPKNYKFIFRKYDSYGNLNVLDLSDGMYKLYSRDVNGRDIVIEPTYSSNMNAALGEIEFNISINNIQKLKGVSETDRFMSIVIINQDNTISSMFDFTYE